MAENKKQKLEEQIQQQEKERFDILFAQMNKKRRLLGLMEVDFLVLAIRPDMEPPFLIDENYNCTEYGKFEDVTDMDIFDIVEKAKQCNVPITDQEIKDFKALSEEDIIKWINS